MEEANNSESIETCGQFFKLVDITYEDIMLARNTDEDKHMSTDEVADEMYQTEEVENTFEEKFVWTDNATKYFLTTYKQKRKLVESRKIKTLKTMWAEISKEMNSNGYCVTKVQVENRFKTLERAYKGTVSNNNKSGRGRKTCNFET